MSFSIVTFNLRCVWDGDGINSFIHRAVMITEKIDAEKPDVICFQEGISRSVAYLKHMLTDYDICFNQRNADMSGEGLAVAVRKDFGNIVGLKAFWLSETPDIPGSRFENQSDCPRVTQCVLIRRKDGQLIRVCNTHLDHVSDSARILGIRCLIEHMKQEQDALPAPLFILGDFNAVPDSDTVKYCKGCDTVPITELTSDINATFHKFGQLDKFVKIDYIYADKSTAKANHKAYIWDECSNGIYLSDHYPVEVTIDL